MDVLPNTDVNFYTALRSIGLVWGWWTLVAVAAVCLFGAWFVAQYATNEYSRRLEEQAAAKAPLNSPEARSRPRPQQVPPQQAPPQRPPLASPPELNLGDGITATRLAQVRHFGRVQARATELNVNIQGQPILRVRTWVLLDSISWAYGARSTFEGADLDELFSNADFISGVGDADYLIGVGLASGVGTDNESLSRNRALHLCSEIYQVGALRRTQTRVYGLPLGRWTGVATQAHSAEERRQRTVVIIAMKRKSGQPNLEDLLSRLFRNDLVTGINLGSYSARTSGDLRLVEMCAARPLSGQ